MPAQDRDIVIVTRARSSNLAHMTEGLGPLLFLPQSSHCLGDFRCICHDRCHLSFTAAAKHVLLKVEGLARGECDGRNGAGTPVRLLRSPLALHGYGGEENKTVMMPLWLGTVTFQM